MTYNHQNFYGNKAVPERVEPGMSTSQKLSRAHELLCEVYDDDDLCNPAFESVEGMLSELEKAVDEQLSFEDDHGMGDISYINQHRLTKSQLGVK